MNCGSICLIEFPFTDGTGSKLRPVLIVSHSSYNQGDDIVVAPISSQPSAADRWSVVIRDDAPEFAATKLKRTSAVKWAKPFTASKRLIRRRLGRLEQPLLGRVLASVASLFRAEGT